MKRLFLGLLLGLVVVSSGYAANYNSAYTGAQVDAGVGLANSASQPADVTSAVATHNSATLNVHGISDTSWIDQDVSSGSSPTLSGANITGIVTGAVEKTIMGVRKGSVGTIAQLKPVYLDGWNVSGFAEVEEADAASDATLPCIGLTSVATTNSATVSLVTSGELTGVDTSSWSVGDDLFVASGGGLTATKPTGSNKIQKVAEVVRSHGSAGVVIVFGAGRVNDVPNGYVIGTDILPVSGGTIDDYTETLYNTTTSGVYNFDLSNGNSQYIVLSNTATLGMPADPGSGKTASFVVTIQPETFAVSWDVTSPDLTWLTSGGTAPTLETTTAMVNVLTFTWAKTRWLGFLGGSETP